MWSFLQQSRKKKTCGVFLAIALLWVVLVAPAQAVTFTVNSPLDVAGAAPFNDGICATAYNNGVPNGVCTLRAAIEEASALAGADQIVLPPDTYILTIVSELIITGDLTIMGAGASTTIIDGNKSLRPFSGVLRINLGVNVLNLNGVTIRNGGRKTDGGGIFNLAGTLTLMNSAVTGNSTNGAGGGIFNSGRLTITNSTVSGNSADHDGGGIYNLGLLTIINSTVSGNRANGNGGGIFNNSAPASLFNATITDNRADADLNLTGTGGGVFNWTPGLLNFQNTILAGNFESTQSIIFGGVIAIFGDCVGTITSNGNNLMQEFFANCAVNGSGVLIADPKLGPLQNNGGSTQTHAALPGSPAIDAGNLGGCQDQFGAMLMTDQRGHPRGVNGDRCDIGAFEVQAATGLVSAVLPSSRSVQVNTPATVFATVINTGPTIAMNCRIALLSTVPVSFVYQTTDPATNQVTEFPNVPANIAAGAAQSFALAITPTVPIAPTDLQFSFVCANTDPAPINVGLNTLLLSASATPVADIVALAVTTSNDGIVTLASTGVFAVATANVGATGIITASADTGSASLPLNISLCQTDPANGQCISTIGGSATTTIDTNATPTFGIFLQGNGNVPFDPATNRIFVRFKDGSNVTRGSTSVAVRTQ
jgi:hypothetical protein